MKRWNKYFQDLNNGTVEEYQDTAQNMKSNDFKIEILKKQEIRRMIKLLENSKNRDVTELTAETIKSGVENNFITKYIYLLKTFRRR